jgi:hypothetical protein
MGIFAEKVLAASKRRPTAARIVVKFAPGVRLPHSEAAEAEHAAAYRQPWEALRSRFASVALRPFFQTLNAAALDDLERRAGAAGLVPRLGSYFAIIVPHGVDATAAAEVVATWSHVELAYVEGGPVPPPVNPTDDPLSANQGYLSVAPAGIDAYFAWVGADGGGIRLVDLEQGWTLDHEDLPASIPIIGSGSFLQDDGWIAHGTAVLGIVAAVDNDKGVIGIAPQSSVRVVSQWFDTPEAQYFSTSNAIASAIGQMNAGDVLLVETTAPPVPKFGWVPAEVDPLNFALIELATALGITVLEPAGNNQEKLGTTDVGGSNLDAFTNAGGKFVLNRASADFMESGAIMVGAGTSAVPHERLGFSNFGSRVDCYAWGHNITTCGGFPLTGSSTPQTAYMTNFAGTSGATAIVAGAAVLLQSWAARNLGHVFAPATLRALLSDPSLNTHSKVPLNDRIGVMPDLRRIILHLGLSRIPRRWEAIFAILFGGVIYGGGGWSWIPGNPPKPVPPRVDKTPFGDLSPERRDLLAALALLDLVGLLSDPAQRKTIEQPIAALMREATEKIAAELEKPLA